MDMLVRGNENRTMSPTEANATSSRSHAVLQINVSSKDRNATVNEPHTMATLSIIDLAGSERASVTKNRGERLLEGANINKSLLALGSCINALCDPRKRNHIPYRNSKLTRLLKFSLGGNCRTVMIVCVSPSSAHFDETQNTLRYANRAKNIQTKVTKNVYNVNRHVKDYLKKIDEQRALIDELKAQSKDYEGIAFAKFRKQSEKKEGILKEGIVRIRSAYEFAAAERQERITVMRKLRQTERRISLLSAWIAGFDFTCENREDEEPPRALATMRKTALGIQTELEGSRQHYIQKLGKNSWERAIETAFQIGVRQLKEVDESEDCRQLLQEAELLKSIADREAFTSVLEQEKGGDAAIVQVLLQAHFETVAILNQMMMMDESEAVVAARNLIGKIMKACSDATSQVIKPDGGLPVTEIFPPTKYGTPKRRKAVNLLGPSPTKIMPKPEHTEGTKTSISPVITSPKRRSPKKLVMISPKKRSPLKKKRGVRWRDDAEDGNLVEFQATPKAMYSPRPTSPAIGLLPPPQFSTQASAPDASSSNSSSPIPSPPQPSFDLKVGRSRFQAGFLSKKGDGSPLSTAPTYANYSSDSEHSPLGEIQINKAPHRSSLHVVQATSPNHTPPEGPSSDEERSYTVDKNDVKKIRTAVQRRSSSTSAALINRAHRRRSPSAASSPPSESMFSASQARRMVKNNHDNADWKASVLSPRTAPIIKGTARRTTMGDGQVREGTGIRSGPVRLSSMSGGPRASLAHGQKNAWR